MKTREVLLKEIAELIDRAHNCEWDKGVHELGEIFKEVNMNDNLADVEAKIHIQIADIALAEQAVALAEAQVKADEAADAPVFAAAGAAFVAAPVVVNEPRFVANKDAQARLERVGARLSRDIGECIKGSQGSGDWVFKESKDFFITCVKRLNKAIQNDDVVLPESLEGIMALYGIDYNAKASEVLQPLCEALGKGLPHIDDH